MRFCASPALREGFRTFRELSEIFSDDNNYSLSRELLVKVGHQRPPGFTSELCLEVIRRELKRDRGIGGGGGPRAFGLRGI